MSAALVEARCCFGCGPLLSRIGCRALVSVKCRVQCTVAKIINMGRTRRHYRHPPHRACIWRLNKTLRLHLCRLICESSRHRPIDPADFQLQ